MAGNRRWTEDEDEAIRNAAAVNRVTGEGVGGRGRCNSRLSDIARALGRSYGAVRNRAMRIGAYSRPDRAIRIGAYIGRRVSVDDSRDTASQETIAVP